MPQTTRVCHIYGRRIASTILDTLPLSIPLRATMSLDKNLFTLTFTPHKDNPNILDLVDPVGTIHYRKQKIVGSKEYKIELYGAFPSFNFLSFVRWRADEYHYLLTLIDPFSESLLATVTSPSAVSKTKMIELYNPTSNVEMRYTGALSFKWSFKWEEWAHIFPPHLEF